MSPWEWFGWIVFIIIISLLFFAAFGNSKYSESSIEEYMENLIEDERVRSGPR
tara:strand:- start:676 stop:834 length:159 start_codon:yes stop_codon:yes gene_type:complete